MAQLRLGRMCIIAVLLLAVLATMCLVFMDSIILVHQSVCAATATRMSEPLTSLAAVSGSSLHVEQPKRFRRWSGTVPTNADLQPAPAERVAALRAGLHPPPPPACKQWIVCTTINDVTPAVRGWLSSMPEWCLCIVADRKTPTPYAVQGHEDRLVVLSVEAQQGLPFKALKATPWNHFGRKSIGYLYCVAAGAQAIYDTDDDNVIGSIPDANPKMPPKFCAEEQVPGPAEPLPTPLYQAPAVGLWNPYPHFGLKLGWPRGYPLHDVEATVRRRQGDAAHVAQDPHEAVTRSVWIRQLLANLDPDVDAIYRMTHGVPANFAPRVPGSVVLHRDTFAPFNAQATLWDPRAFWGLLLPVTVHGRVSDILRGYLVQRLMWELGGRLAFSEPGVYQPRNAHSYYGDFASELPLYTRTNGLLTVLRQWKWPVGAHVGAAMVDLWVTAYEYGYVERDDVQLVEAFVADLAAVGYEFAWPPTKAAAAGSAPPKRGRIAVCLTGFPRTMAATGACLRHTLHRWLTGDGWEYDVFAVRAPAGAITDTVSYLRPVAVVDSDPNPPNLEAVTKLFGHGKSVAYQVSDWATCEPLRKGYEAETGIKYDRVIRMRTDLYLHHLPVLSALDADALYVSNMDSYGGFNDRFVIGSPENVDAFCGVYHHLIPANVSIDPLRNPETALGAWAKHERLVVHKLREAGSPNSLGFLRMGLCHAMPYMRAARDSPAWGPKANVTLCPTDYDLGIL